MKTVVVVIILERLKLSLQVDRVPGLAAVVSRWTKRMYMSFILGHIKAR
jgi:hypothetical protein